MMGKSRLMKEMTAHIPAVYICLRSSDSQSGYPKRSPIIADWFDKGAANVYPTTLPRSTMLRDRLHFLGTLKYSAFLLALVQQLSILLSDPDVIRRFNICENATQNSYKWMWEFFAEPLDTDTKLEEFWYAVVASATNTMSQRTTGAFAESYLRTHYGDELLVSYKKLLESFVTVGYELSDDFAILLLCDEARRLCESSVADGSKLHGDCNVTCGSETQAASSIDLVGMIPFSHFRALTRALRFCSIANDPVPRIFALFTDTYSRLSNFQPSPDYDRSMRVLSLPVAGPEQFPPLFLFTSFDAWARIHNRCVGIEEVANPERLVQFGRAGWVPMYRVHRRGADGRPRPVFHTIDVVLAEGKLLNVEYRNRFGDPWTVDALTRNTLLKLLSVIAPRLAVTAGPLTHEAAEMVASHMAVLVRTDRDRHFLRTLYPSEPILAEASANLTAKYGWGRPLQALHYFIQSGIVDAGYRGELLSKIVFLMAVDNVLASGSKLYDPREQWKYSRPISVSEFLDELIRFPLPESRCGTDSAKKTAISSCTSFSEYVFKYSKINKDDLTRVMKGSVFFNHFVRVEYTIGIETLVQAWNRGAAIMCKAYNPRFDHIIPVLLEAADPKKFGPLFGKWNDDQVEEARKYVSYILIDSKNYNSKENWTTRLSHVSPIDNNDAAANPPLLPDAMYIDEPPAPKVAVYNLLDSQPSNNVCLSIIQDFGPLQGDEETFIVDPVSYTELRTRYVANCPIKQLSIILKGAGDDTYKCLMDRIVGQRDVDREETRMFLEEIRNSKVDILDGEPSSVDPSDEHPLSFLTRLNRIAAIDTVPIMLGLGFGWDADWDKFKEEKEREHVGEPMEDVQLSQSATT